jgi:hypothetical protein
LFSITLRTLGRGGFDKKQSWLKGERREERGERREERGERKEERRKMKDEREERREEKV